MSKREKTIKKRQNEQKKRVIRALKKTPIVQVACKKAGISRSTYYRWRKESHEFTQLTNEAIEEGDSLINDMAQSQLVSAIKDKNMTAIIFWLKRRHPAFTNKLKLSGEIKHSRKELTDEEKEMVRQAVKLALPDGKKKVGKLKDKENNE